MTTNHIENGKNNPMGQDTTKHDGEALGKVKAFLNLRNKRLDGANPTIASLVNDDHCAVRLNAPDLHDVVCEIDTLRELYAVTCQSNDRQREAIKAQSSEIHALLSRVADQAAEIERLRGALEFYADPKTWKTNGHPQIDADLKPIVRDGGDVARKALKGGAA